MLSYLNAVFRKGVSLWAGYIWPSENTMGLFKKTGDFWADGSYCKYNIRRLCDLFRALYCGGDGMLCVSALYWFFRSDGYRIRDFQRHCGSGWPRILRHRFRPLTDFWILEKMAYHAGNLDERLYIYPVLKSDCLLRLLMPGRNWGKRGRRTTIWDGSFGLVYWWHGGAWKYYRLRTSALLYIISGQMLEPAFKSWHMF